MPFIFTAEEIARILSEAARRKPGEFSSVVFHTALGLIASTGLRAAQALGLDRNDVMPRDRPGTLFIRHSKFDESRIVPVHPSVAQQLGVYADQRESLGYGAHTAAFFVSRHGGRLSYESSSEILHEITTSLGITARNGSRAGWEIYHIKGSPADPNRLYASQSSGWFGQMIQRSNDQRWRENVGARGQPVHVRWSARYAPVVRRHAAPVGVQACLASGAVAERSGHGLRRHRRRGDDAGDSWCEVSGNLPTDFGFPIDVHAHELDSTYVVPIKSDEHHYPPDGKLPVYRSRTGGNEWEALTNDLPQSNCYVNVLGDAMAVDSLDSCGVYFGTTGGQVYASADAGDTWAPIARGLPSVLSVEVQTLR
jgi:hypothetical protein